MSFNSLHFIPVAFELFRSDFCHLSRWQRISTRIPNTNVAYFAFFFPSRKGPFKYYVIMILAFFDPPTLSADIIISYTRLKDDVTIFSYPPTLGTLGSSLRSGILNNYDMFDYYLLLLSPIWM